MYVPTKRSSVADKMSFRTQFYKFVTGGYREEDFPKWFYRRLGTMYGLSLHFNRSMFYEHWFSTANRQYDFLVKILTWQSRGDPKLTYSDVEQDLQKLAIKEGWLSQVLDQAVAEYLGPNAGPHLPVPPAMCRVAAT
jgi:hypothetical protein